jgi:hypothetical protein
MMRRGDLPGGLVFEAFQLQPGELRILSLPRFLTGW